MSTNISVTEAMDAISTLELQTAEESGQFVVAIRGKGVDLSCQGATREQALERIALQGTAELAMHQASLPAPTDEVVERVADLISERVVEMFNSGSDYLDALALAREILTAIGDNNEQ